MRWQDNPRGTMPVDLRRQAVRLSLSKQACTATRRNPEWSLAAFLR